MMQNHEIDANKLALHMNNRIKWDALGLIPAVVQDAVSKDVLMMAYMNRESLQISLETGQAWFWSRSRGELWHKGATSGNTLNIKSIKLDCDQDTILLFVDPAGPACHTGKYSCFYQDLNGRLVPDEPAADSSAGSSLQLSSEPSTKQDVRSNRFEILSTLESVIASRDAERPQGAYTTYLFEKGIDKILKKVGEETAEVIIAAKNKDNDELRYEASDLIFHLMVLLREAKLPLDDLMQELDRRHLKK